VTLKYEENINHAVSAHEMTNKSYNDMVIA